MKYFILLFSAVMLFGCGAGSPRFTSEEESVREEKRDENIREIRKTEIEKEEEEVTEEMNTESIINTVEPVMESIVGVASFYADKFHGRKTANGETYNMHALTAAHLSYPFNTEIKVTNLSNDKSVVVRINDRKPYDDGRVIDLSFGAAKEIGMVKAGISKVKLEILKWGSK